MYWYCPVNLSFETVLSRYAVDHVSFVFAAFSLTNPGCVHAANAFFGPGAGGGDAVGRGGRLFSFRVSPQEALLRESRILVRA